MECNPHPKLNGSPKEQRDSSTAPGTMDPAVRAAAQRKEESGFEHPFLCVSAWYFDQRTQRVSAEQKLVSPCGEMLAKRHENLCEIRVRPWRSRQGPFHWVDICSHGCGRSLSKGGVLSQERGVWWEYSWLVPIGGPLLLFCHSPQPHVYFGHCCCSF